MALLNWLGGSGLWHFVNRGYTKSRKVKLAAVLPSRGLVADAAWLEKYGNSRALQQKYVAHGWLDQGVRGVYGRPAPKLPGESGQESVAWQPVVISRSYPCRHCGDVRTR